MWPGRPTWNWRKAWYLPQLERIHDDAQVRKLDVDQLVRLAAGYASRERFLTELTLDPPQATSDQSGVPHLDEDYLILSTIHSAKGQEWKAVHVLNVVDGCIPSDMATGTTDELEEERRLLYVAMTRAKEHLHLIVPHRFYVTQQAGGGDRHVYAGRSRFITEAMAGQFERVTWPRGRPQRDSRRQRSRRRRCCRCGPGPRRLALKQVFGRAGTASYAAAQALPTTAVFRPA